MSKNSKGFTLIELLVVISIIALLSSVVLAAVKDARDKAKISKFRSEINQLVTALELYKADNNIYPHQNLSIFTLAGRYQNGQEFVTGAGASVLSNYLVPNYMAKIPEIINPNTRAVAAFAYRKNSNTPSASNPNVKCVNDLNTPSYILYILNDSAIDILNYKAVNDWQSGFVSDYGNGYTASVVNNKCFSLK